MTLGHSSSVCLCRHICCLLSYHYFVSDIKIVQFRNGLEGRASQMSSVQLLLNSKDLLNPEPQGIKLQSCKCFFWLFTDPTLYFQSKLYLSYEKNVHCVVTVRALRTLLTVIWCILCANLLFSTSAGCLGCSFFAKTIWTTRQFCVHFLYWHINLRVSHQANMPNTNIFSTPVVT